MALPPGKPVGGGLMSAGSKTPNEIRHFWISGRVQGVGFRFFVERCACALGLCGWVRNLTDGRVEVLASGTPDALSRLEERLHAGPPGARVEAIVTETSPATDETPFETFEIRRS